jgi:hypothetical protein
MCPYMCTKIFQVMASVVDNMVIHDVHSMFHKAKYEWQVYHSMVVEFIHFCSKICLSRIPVDN